MYGFNYTNVNSVMGVLSCVSAELYRRLAAPYEDRKIKENGDVY
jgi:broad-specificity NMP kinase